MKKGHIMTEEHKRKISEAQKGVPRFYVHGKNNPMKKPENKLKISLALTGIKRNVETIEKNRQKSLGRKLTLEHRLKISLANRGSKSHLWKGGISATNRPMRKNIEQSIEYKLWRLAVFVRDNFICQLCFERGGKLHADHIKPFASFPELRTELSNGRTLCPSCHRTTPTYGRRSLLAKAT